MVARLLREARAALEGLDDEVVGDVAREAEMDGGVDHRLHHQEHVGGPGARDRGRHRDPLLVLDLELRAERARAAPAPGRAGPRSSPGVAYQTVMPLPIRAGVLGIARTTWSWPSVATRALVVGPGEHRQHELALPAGSGPISRPTRASIWGLTARMMTSAPATASMFEATVRIPWAAASASRRSAAGGWPRPGTAETRLPRSRPTIMASAMTPEPTVAIVRFSRGDIAPEDSTGSRPPDVRAPVRRRPQPASAATSRKKRPVVVRSSAAEARPPERGLDDAGVVPGPRDRRPAARRPGRDGARSRPGGRRAGGAARSDAVAVSRPAPRTRPSRNAASTRVGAGLAGSRRHDPRVGDVEVGAQAVGEQPVARAIERRAVGVRDVELALARDQRREEPDARARLLDPAGQRLVVEPAGDDVELGLPGRVVEGAARELAAAQEPVVGERRRRRRAAASRRGAGRPAPAVAGRRGGRPGPSVRRPPVVDRRRRRRGVRAAAARLDRRRAGGRGGTGS